MKLTRERLEAVHIYIDYLLKMYPAENKAEMLVQLMVNRVRIKMRNRLDQLNKRNGYRVNLTQEEAMAFEIWFNQMPRQESIFIYENNIVRQLCNDIDKQYG
ncbi:MAG: hypothetical protein WBP45_13190 [Daejeonella sp.]